MDFEIDQPFCFDAPLSLVSKDLGAIEVILLLLVLSKIDKRAKNEQLSNTFQKRLLNDC